jgi:hypothetical protein
MDTRTLFPVSPDSTSIGLTRLEAFAMAAMQGMLAFSHEGGWVANSIPIRAATFAEALEKECDRIQAERVKGSV